MAFWSDPSLEPKRSFRFRVTFGGQATDLPHWIVKQVNRPQMTVGEIAHKYLIHTYYYPGKVEWNEVKMTLVDPVSPDAATTMRAMLASSGYFHPVAGGTSAPEMRSLGKGTSTNTIGKVLIEMVNDAGVPVEKWELKNAWIKSVNFSDLSYETEELSNIELTLRYDWAELNELKFTVP